MHDSAREFLAEIEKEAERQKFTFAELAEYEQNYQRLANWLEKIQKRNITGGEKSREENNTLKSWRMVFENFSAEDYNRQAKRPSTNTNL